MKTQAAFFDLDKTIHPINAENSFGIYLYKKKLLSFGDLRRIISFYIKYLLGFFEDINESKRNLAKIVVAGKNKDQLLKEFKVYFENYLKPRIYPEAEFLIREHKRQGRPVYIISASIDYMVEFFADYLGVNGFHATKLEDDNGILTGNIIGTIHHGETKAIAVECIAREMNIDLAESYAYGDNITDREMLESVGFPVAVNPRGEMKRVALDKGWTIARWGLSDADAFSQEETPGNQFTEISPAVIE